MNYLSNIFNEDYYHPSVDVADAGEDTSKPSQGWYSSRLPWPERNFIFGLRTNLKKGVFNEKIS